MRAKYACCSLTDERAIIEWMARLERYDQRTIRENKKEIKHARSLSAQWPSGRAAPDGAGRARSSAHPSATPRRPFEVIGIPLPEPGYYVLEAASRRLGASLLGKDVPMYVRSSALVTNLAVHPKIGHARSAVWVTSLDRGRAVDGAEIRIIDCNGEEVWHGRSGADGVAAVEQALGEAPRCGRTTGWFVSARSQRADGRRDFSFAWSHWSDGIEPWRFDIATAWDSTPVLRVHSVLDRPLYRAGETVSMKHYLRRETVDGLAMVEPEGTARAGEGSPPGFGRRIPAADRLGRRALGRIDTQAAAGRRRRVCTQFLSAIAMPADFASRTFACRCSREASRRRPTPRSTRANCRSRCSCASSPVVAPAERRCASPRCCKIATRIFPPTVDSRFRPDAATRTDSIKRSSPTSSP